MIINREKCIYCESKLKNILQLKEFPIKFTCLDKVEKYERSETLVIIVKRSFSEK